MPTDSTLKQYRMRMELLKKADINPVQNPASVIAWFDKQELGASSRKVYLSAIKHFFPDTFPKPLQELLNELYQAQNKKDVKQELTTKQQQNFVKWTDLVNAQATLAAATKTDVQWRQYLIASLYTLNAPVRADYGEMEVFARQSKKRTGNELIWNKTPKFVFRVYKTAKTYGEVIIPVSKPLQNVIREWFQHLDTVPKYLLGDSPLSSMSFAVYVARVFHKLLGKEVGISLVRHSYITHIFPSLKTIAQKQAVAMKMLHSRDLQEKYVSLKDMD